VQIEDVIIKITNFAPGIGGRIFGDPY